MWSTACMYVKLGGKVHITMESSHGRVEHREICRVGSLEGS